LPVFPLITSCIPPESLHPSFCCFLGSHIIVVHLLLQHGTFLVNSKDCRWNRIILPMSTTFPCKKLGRK
jgi:hypothetical protein